MSNNVNGVIFEADDNETVEFFSNLNPVTFLRLTLLDADGLWGIYAEGWTGDREVLDEIARLASIKFGTTLRYCYASAVGFLSDLYENGQLTRTENSDLETTPRFEGELFEVFGRSREMHDIVEAKFTWQGNDWVLEHVWQNK